MITETFFYVKFSEIDSLGIVHHSRYPLWFEAGRSDFFRKAGISTGKLDILGLSLPLLEMKCEFKSPAKYGNEILVITKPVYMSYVKLKFEYKILNKLNGKILAAGKTVHAWTDRKLEPLNIGKAAPEVYRKLRSLVEPTVQLEV